MHIKPSAKKSPAATPPDTRNHVIAGDRVAGGGSVGRPLDGDHVARADAVGAGDLEEHHIMCVREERAAATAQREEFGIHMHRVTVTFMPAHASE